MSELTKSELKNAYRNMQEIIFKQEKQIEDLKKQIDDDRIIYQKNYDKLKSKFNTEMEILAGVEPETVKALEPSVHAVWLQKIRVLSKHSTGYYNKMLGDFSRLVERDIKNNKPHSTLSAKQKKVIDDGIKRQNITDITVTDYVPNFEKELEVK